MLKKVLTGTGIAAVLAAVFLLGSLSVGNVSAQTQDNTNITQVTAQSAEDDDAAEAAVQDADTDNIELEEQVGDQSQVDEQQPQYTGSISVDETQYQGMSEADEAAALQTKATISAADAEQAALTANPGTTVIKTELDNENGVLVYSVELSNGMDVKVDAGNGNVLYTEQAGNDASEVGGAENTSEQEAVED